MLLLLAVACEAPRPSPPPPPSPGSDSGSSHLDSTDTGDTASASPLPEGLSWGDPIETTSRKLTEVFFEHLDATRISEDRGLLVSNNGLVVVDLDTGEIINEELTGTGYNVEWDPSIDVAWVGRKDGGDVWKVDVSEPDEPEVVLRGSVGQGGHDDLDCEEGLLLVAGHDEGARLFSADLESISVFEADYAVGAGLHEGVAVITDGGEAVLIDWKDPEEPVELHRLALPATGWDLDFDGTHVAIAMGSHGVAVLSIGGEGLVLDGVLPSPGGVYGVALDGDWLWAAAWSEVMSIWLGGEEPVVVGHEPSGDSAMALGAVGDGRVLVADWTVVTMMRRNDGLAGPEADVREEIWAPSDGAEPQPISVFNGGAATLDVLFDDHEDYLVDPLAVTLDPGERAEVDLQPRSSPVEATITWTSNDPDEPTGEVQVHLASSTVGQPHPDFDLVSVTADAPTVTTPISLSDLHGEVAYIGWFAPS